MQGQVVEIVYIPDPQNKTKGGNPGMTMTMQSGPPFTSPRQTTPPISSSSSSSSISRLRPHPSLRLLGGGWYQSIFPNNNIMKLSCMCIDGTLKWEYEGWFVVVGSGIVVQGPTVVV
eukprot:scaffold22100_cov137-Amphora_coffeaeformis.AAC.2